MPALFSNQLKALLVLDDITEDGVSVWQNNCFTVQHFSYACERERNQAGIPFGPTQTSYLNFTVKIATGESGKLFFERLGAIETYPFSFIFNASFGDNKRMTECEDAMVATGYLVEVEEAFDEPKRKNGSQEQMLIKGTLLISNLEYLGQEKPLQLMVTND